MSAPSACFTENIRPHPLQQIHPSCQPLPKKSCRRRRLGRPSTRERDELLRWIGLAPT